MVRVHFAVNDFGKIVQYHPRKSAYCTVRCIPIPSLTKICPWIGIPVPGPLEPPLASKTRMLVIPVIVFSASNIDRQILLKITFNFN